MHSTSRALSRISALALAGILMAAGCGDGDADALPTGSVDAGGVDAGSIDASEPGTSYAPLPETARGVPIDPARGYALEEIRDGLYWVTNGSEQAAFLVSTEGVIVIDAPPYLTDALAAAVQSVTTQPITHIVYSHYHADHIAGAGRLSTTAQIVAHTETQKALERAADPNRPIPTITFEESYTLTVGNQTLELSYHGPNHVPGNIFIHAPLQRTLMVIDIVWPGWVPFVELGEAEDLPGYRAALDTALTLDFDIFIGGHVGRYGNKSDVERTKEYVDDVFAAAGRALQAVNINEIAQEVGYENPYALVDVWFDRMKVQCADELTTKWVGRLGGADAWAETHCFVAFQSLRID